MNITTERFSWPAWVLGRAFWQRFRIGILFLSLLLLSGQYGFGQQSGNRIDSANDCIAKCNSEIRNLSEQKGRTLKEFAQGLFCSECERSASEIEASGRVAFSTHLKNVKGRPVPASQAQLNRKAHEFDQKISAVQSRRESCERQKEEALYDRQEQEKQQAQRQRNEQAMTYQRMQEEQAAQQRDRVRQAQEQFQTAQDNKRKRFEVRSERNRQTVETLGEGLSGLVNAIVNSQKDQSTDDDEDSAPIPDRSSSNSKQFVVTDPNLRVPETPERSRVIGEMENGQFIPNPPPPEPAKPLFDSLSSFVSEVAKETTRSLAQPTAESLLSGGYDDPREGALKNKLNELADSIIDTVLPADHKVAYYFLKGDFQEAQAEAIKLLPPERQFEARAMQLPASVITRDESGKLSDIWDKDVLDKLGMPPDSSGAAKVNGQLLDAAERLLARSRPQVEVVTAETETSFLNRKRDPNVVAWGALKRMTPEEGWAYYRNEHARWDANKQQTWKSYVPSAASQAEADLIMRKTFRLFETELQTRDRILKAMEELQSK